MCDISTAYDTGINSGRSFTNICKKEMLTRVIHCYILLIRGDKQCITACNSLWIKKERKLLYCEGKLERQGKQGEHYYLQFIDGTDL